MPRSSGGGSHSGGYHSSSSSSSHSHSSGGGSHSSGYHSSSSSSRSSSSYSSHSYGGGYSSHSSYGHPSSRPSHVHHTSYYSSPTYHAPRHPRRERERETHLWRLIFWIPLLILVFQAGIETVFEPSKVNTNYDTRIVIEDNTGVLKDPAALETSLTTFLDRTGISPSVITIYNDDWEPYYTSLENKAFDLYVNHFDDEKHWLIVYSGPHHANPSFTEWSWEGIQGDDTDIVLTPDICDDFGQRLQKYLTADRYTVDQALCRAFDETTANLPETDPDWGYTMFAFLLVFGLMLWGACRRTGILLLFSKSSSTSIPVNAMKGIVPESPKSAEPAASVKTAAETSSTLKPDECACSYCGSIYKINQMACPQCGATRKA